MTVLSINGITKKFKNNRGVFDISFSIEEGQIFGFLGPNGSGKTTTLKMIMQMLYQDSGTIEVCGHNVGTDFERAIRNVGSMFESTVFYPNLTAYENMLQLARYYPEIEKSRIDELLKIVGMISYRDEKVSKFSLGMRQRLAIACAFYGKPRLLVMDEPFNGLDIEGIVEIRKVIVDMAEKDGASFLISSHMAAEMEKLCTHVGIIKNGQFFGAESIENIQTLYPSLENYFIKTVEQADDNEKAVV